MNLDADDEILQDFVVEATEILDQMGEQLVDLEQQPEDTDLLNAIFRGFHTVKGGAGFLSITHLVEACHRAEDVFNVLRQGQRTVSAELMDAILQTLDVVNAQMRAVREGLEPDAAGRDLIARLEMLALPEETSTPRHDQSDETAAAETGGPATDVAAVESPVSVDTPAVAPGGGDITEAEFEALLDELHGKGKPGGQPKVESAAAASASDEITADEFESLLDELHGKGRHASAPKAVEKASASSDAITDNEFEALPDELHGAGKHGGVPGGANPAVAAGASVAKQQPANSGLVPGRVAATAPPPAAEQPARETPSPLVAAANKTVASGVQVRQPQGETTVRVDTQRLDDIMNMVGELVLVRNRLSTLKTAMADEALANAVSNLDVVTADLQLAVMKTRMQPVKKVFGRFPRVVRDLARNLKKEVELEMHGEDTDLDKNLVEALADPMVHLVRNAVDHGIESPEARAASGKPRRGRVVLSAAQEGDSILLCIEDDGKGMDPDVLRRKAVEKGVMDEEAAARLDSRECYNLIFHPGFSTKTEISDVSGRGVGMDVVKTKIAQMNGSVEIDSEPGRGSKIVIKLPLTLAILPTLMVILGEQPFALPLASVVEIFNLDLGRTNTVDGQLTIRMRKRALPLFYLSDWLVNGRVSSPDHSSGGTGHVVVVNAGGLQVGLVVDFLVGQEEVVIKPLGALLQGLDGMAGATITGDGKIALILDVPGLMRKYARRF